MTFRAYDLLKLTQDHGQALTLRKITTVGTYDASTGSMTGSATTDFAFIGYYYDFATQLDSGDELRRGIRKCVIPALGFAAEPDDEDIIIGPATTGAIERVVTLFSSGSAVCYLCEVRE